MIRLFYGYVQNENQGRKYSPDLTVLLFYENDVWFNTQARYWRGRKPYFVLKEGVLDLVGLEARDPRVTASLTMKESVKGWVKNLRLYGLANRALENSPFFFLWH